MTNYNTGCFGNYDFDHISEFARKRFIDGISTINLLKQAKSDTEREEISLVCMLDVEDKFVIDVELDCRYSQDCETTNCRDRLRKLIEHELKLDEESLVNFIE